MAMESTATRVPGGTQELSAAQQPHTVLRTWGDIPLFVQQNILSELASDCDRGSKEDKKNRAESSAKVIQDILKELANDHDYRSKEDKRNRVESSGIQESNAIQEPIATPDSQQPHDVLRPRGDVPLLMQESILKELASDCGCGSEEDNTNCVESSVIQEYTAATQESTAPQVLSLSATREPSATPEPHKTLRPWAHIPALVQDLILKELGNDYDRESKEDKRNRAAYAAVCPEWQEYFEALNFKRLVLHPAALDEFQSLLQRRQAPQARLPMPRIRHLWLRIELPKYDCDSCKRPESPQEMTTNDRIFTAAVWRLLDILSTWEKKDVEHGQDITLELSAHSPSDSQHFYQRVPTLQDGFPYLADESEQIRYMDECSNRKRFPVDLDHGYDSGTTLKHPLVRTWKGSIASADRFSRPLAFDFTDLQVNCLREVKMVKSFEILGKHFRNPRPSALARLYATSLTNLRSIRHVTWMALWPRLALDVNDDDLALSLSSPYGQTTLPSSLESLHLYEYAATEPVTFPLLQDLAVACPRLKHLSVCNLSDATEWFATIQGHTFENLETVAWTCESCLRPSQPDLNKLLYEAALAAMKMPKLRIMEIWNTHAPQEEEMDVALVRYESTGTSTSTAATLTWSCSWEMGREERPAQSIKRRVVEAWERVASTHVDRRLTLAVLPFTTFSAEADMSRDLLKLKRSILDPVSMKQLCMKC